MAGHLKCGECLVLGDLIIRNVGTEYSDMKIECYLGIRTEQLHRVIEYRDLGSSDTVVNDERTYDLRRTGNLNYVTGDVCDLVHMAKTKFLTSRIVLSSVLWKRDVSWRRIGAINSRYDWVTKTLIMHMCCCVEVSVKYLNYKRNISWWMDGRFVIRHTTKKKNVLVQVAGRYKIWCTVFVRN